MPTCRECKESVDELVTVKIAGKTVKRCADCADRAREADEISAESESVMRSMMGYKGR